MYTAPAATYCACLYCPSSGKAAILDHLEKEGHVGYFGVLGGGGHRQHAGLGILGHMRKKKQCVKNINLEQDPG